MSRSRNSRGGDWMKISAAVGSFGFLAWPRTALSSSAHVLSSYCTLSGSRGVGTLATPEPPRSLPLRLQRRQRLIHPCDVGLFVDRVGDDELPLLAVQRVEDGHPVPFRAEQFRPPLEVGAVFRLERSRPVRLAVHVPQRPLGALFH